MKFLIAIISVICNIGAIGIPLSVSAEPLAISLTQRDGKVSPETCMNQGKIALQQRNFQNIVINENSIKGDYQEYLAIISCYEITTTKGVVVQSIIVTGPIVNGARQLRDEIVKAID